MNVRGFQGKAAPPPCHRPHYRENRDKQERGACSYTPTYLIRQKTDFSWVKSLRPEPRTNGNGSEQGTISALGWEEPTTGKLSVLSTE